MASERKKSRTGGGETNGDHDFEEILVTFAKNLKGE